eukprot:PhM_4_TR10567/c1_g1_i1/m.2685
MDAYTKKSLECEAADSWVKFTVTQTADYTKLYPPMPDADALRQRLEESERRVRELEAELAELKKNTNNKESAATAVTLAALIEALQTQVHSLKATETLRVKACETKSRVMTTSTCVKDKLVETLATAAHTTYGQKAVTATKTLGGYLPVSVTSRVVPYIPEEIYN